MCTRNDGFRHINNRNLQLHNMCATCLIQFAIFIAFLRESRSSSIVNCEKTEKFNPNKHDTNVIKELYSEMVLLIPSPLPNVGAKQFQVNMIHFFPQLWCLSNQAKSSSTSTTRSLGETYQRGSMHG